MNTPRIAFYAPLKPPDHPIPSGDREIGRLLMKALAGCGYEVALASRYISYQKRPSSELFCERRDGAIAERQRLAAQYRSGPQPDLWFTYHPYCKSPDWIGPEIAAELGIPYVTAEACRTGQASDADWNEARKRVQGTVAGAAVNFCLKTSDYDYLRSFLPSMDRVVPLLPFIDLSEILAGTSNRPDLPFTDGAPVIITAGMMRPGWKVTNYLVLARALQRLADIGWNLVVIGDGPANGEIKAAFSFLPESRIHWTGALEKKAIPGVLATGDIFAWPGLHEAIGMIFLEAQAVGLPVAAMRSYGVPLVVKDGVTGLLGEPENIEHHTELLRRLITGADLRIAFGKAAAAHVRTTHDLPGAVATLKEKLDPLLSIRNS